MLLCLARKCIWQFSQWINIFIIILASSLPFQPFIVRDCHLIVWPWSLEFCVFSYFVAENMKTRREFPGASSVMWIIWQLTSMSYDITDGCGEKCWAKTLTPISLTILGRVFQFWSSSFSCYEIWLRVSRWFDDIMSIIEYITLADASSVSNHVMMLEWNVVPPSPIGQLHNHVTTASTPILKKLSI